MRRLLALPVAFWATAAFAQDSIYIGIGTGKFDYAEDSASPIVGRVADEVSVGKIFGGFQINDYVAFEIDLAQTHHVRQSGSQTVQPIGVVSGFLSLDLTTTSLKGVGQLPFEWGALLGGIGYFTGETGFTESFWADCCETVVNGGSFDEDGMMAMAGIEWRWGRFGTRYAVRLEYEWWDLSGVDASAVGIALSYGF